MITLVVFALAMCAQAADASWREFRQGPARTGAATSANAATLTVGWRQSSGDEANMNSSPAVVDHHVFVAGSGLGYGTVTSYTSGGRLAWTGYLPFGTDSSPAVVGGRVFVASCDTLDAFDETTGSKLWETTYPVQGVISCSDQSSPVVVGGVVYAGSDADGKLHAVSAASGGILWTSSDLGVRSSATVAGGYVLIGANNHHLYAFPQTCQTPCQPAWSRDLGNVVQATPAVVGGIVYTHSWTSPLYALDLTNGNTLWTSAGAGGGVSSPAVAGGVVYDLGQGVSETLNAYDAATGRLLWAALGADGYGSPAAANDIVVTTCRYALCVHSTSDGALLLRIRPSLERVFSSAAIGDRALYASRQDELLYKIGL